MVDDVFFILKKSSSRALATQVRGLYREQVGAASELLVGVVVLGMVVVCSWQPLLVASHCLPATTGV
jgi:hypothetical protein